MITVVGIVVVALEELPGNEQALTSSPMITSPTLPARKVEVFFHNVVSHGTSTVSQMALLLNRFIYGMGDR